MMSNISNDTKIKIAPVDDVYSHLSTALEAFLISRMTSQWMTVQTLLHGCGNCKEDEFYSALQKLIETGLILLESKPQATSLKTPVERHYPNMDIASFILSKSLKGIQKKAIKEVVFLSSYGKSIDFYRRLGLKTDPLGQSVKNIQSRINNYSTFFTNISSRSQTNGQFLQHIEKAHSIINETGILLSTTARETYNKQLIEQGIYQSKIKKKEVASGFKHYAEAIKLLKEERVKESMTAIQIALQIEPENSDYLGIKEKIQHHVKQKDISTLLHLIDNNETLMWDERLLHKTLNQLFQLDNFVATRIKVANILMKKNAFTIALDVLRESPPTDQETRKQIAELQRELKKKHKLYKAKL